MSMDAAVLASPTAPPLSRSQILQVTSQCLRELGYDATTIRQIATTLHCAVGSIYRYFDDKRELLSAVAQQTLDPVVELLDEGGSFAASVERYARCAAQDPEVYRLLFWLVWARDHQAAQRDVPHADHSNEQPALPAVVERIIDLWAQKLDNPQLARRVWAVLHGAITLGETPAQALQLVLALSSAPALFAPRITARPAASAQPPARREAPAPIWEAAPAGADAVLTADIKEDVCLL